MHTGGEGRERGVRFEKLWHKNSKKHEKGDLLDFLTTPSTTLKFGQKNPRKPPGFPTTVHL